MSEMFDNVAGISTTTGTVSYAISGSLEGFRPFSVVPDGTEITVKARMGAAWEIVTGICSASGTALTRASLNSSSTGSFIDWGAGTKTLELIATSSMLQPSPLITAMTHSRDKLRFFSHLLGTPYTFSSSTTGDTWGADQAEVWVSGAGASVVQGSAVLFGLGIAICSTGTTTTGYAGITSTVAPLYISSAATVIDGRLLANLSNAPGGVNNFTAQVGFFTDPTALAVQGLFFRGNNSNTNWIAVSKNADGETTTDTGIVCNTDWHTFRASYDFNTGNAIFEIDGDQVASISTNIPTPTPLHLGAVIHKTAGTASRQIRLDAYSLEMGESGGTGTYL